MNYEELLIEAEKQGIEILESDRIGELKGLYIDNIIVINSKIETSSEKLCILAEEIGHHYKTIGNILDQSNVSNIKQERIARAWGYEKLVSLESIIKAYKNGIRNKYELAEFLEVTEEFLEDAIKHYQRKHGLYCKVHNFYIYFNPLLVLETLDYNFKCD